MSNHQPNVLAGLDPQSLLMLMNLMQNPQTLGLLNALGPPNPAAPQLNAFPNLLPPPAIPLAAALPAMNMPAPEAAAGPKRRGRPKKAQDPALAAARASEKAAQKAAKAAQKAAEQAAKKQAREAAAEARRRKKAIDAAVKAAIAQTPATPDAPRKGKRKGPTPAELLAAEIRTKRGRVALQHKDEMPDGIPWNTLCDYGSIVKQQKQLPLEQRTIGTLNLAKHTSQKAWFTLLPKEMLLNQWYKRPDVPGLPKGSCMVCTKALKEKELPDSWLGVTMTHVPQTMRDNYGINQAHWATIKYKCAGCIRAAGDDESSDGLEDLLG